MSLRWRLALTFGILTFVAVIVASVAAYFATSRQLVAETDRSLQETIRGYRPIERRFDDRLERRFPPLGGGGAVQVLAADGTVAQGMRGGEVLPVTDVDREVARGEREGGVVHTVEVDGEPVRLATTALRNGGAIQAARSLEEVDGVLRQLRVRLGFFGLLLGLVAGAAGWFLAGRITRPVESLTSAAEHVATTEDLSGAIDVTGADEVGRLGRAFNAMLGSLSSSRAQQQRLVEDAAHELRTPLTSLRTNVEVLQRAHDLAPEDRARLLSDVEAELAELTSLTSELVELAREPGGDDEDRVEVGLDAVVRAAVGRAQRRTDRQIVVHTSPAVVTASQAALDRAIANLIWNALKFGPPGTTVEVTQSGGQVSVRDHGRGIDPADRPYVFDRFYRSTAARSTPGSGLGLAIVARVVRQHGGSVFAGDAPDGGAVVGFTLPTL